METSSAEHSCVTSEVLTGAYREESIPRGRCWELSSRKVQRIVGKLPDVDLRALGSKVLQGAPTDKPEIFP